MFPDDKRARAATEAAYHIQLAIDAVEFAVGEGAASGRIVRVFRGPTTMRGSHMTLRVPCTGGGDDDDWPPDGIGRIPAESLHAGRVLEAFVDVTPAGCEIALGLYTVLDAATDVPQLKT